MKDDLSLLVKVITGFATAIFIGYASMLVRFLIKSTHFYTNLNFFQVLFRTIFFGALSAICWYKIIEDNKNKLDD